MTARTGLFRAGGLSAPPVPDKMKQTLCGMQTPLREKTAAAFLYAGSGVRGGPQAFPAAPVKGPRAAWRQAFLSRIGGAGNA